jgi:dihydroflavonol-4-reductase
MSGKIAAVTGASGHVGANLVRALLEEGREVRVLLRADSRAVAGLPVERIEGDVLDRRSLARLMEGAETVFHAAGRISIVGPEHGLVDRTNVLGVRNVIEACLDAGVRRLVHFSSIHAYSAEPHGECISEERSLALGPGEAPYDRSKALGQREVMEAAERGLEAVVVNPTAIIGPHDYKGSRMGRVLLGIATHALPAVIDGGYNWVDVRDVARGAIAAEKRGRSGQCYLLPGRWVHIRDVSLLIHRLTGRKTPLWAAPMWLARPASGFALAWGLALGKEPLFTPAAVRALCGHKLVSGEKAEAELDYRPQPFEETIYDTLEWFLKEGLWKGELPARVRIARAM